MLKVFGTQVVVSRGYDGAAAIKFSEKGDAVRFRIGKKAFLQGFPAKKIYLFHPAFSE